MTNGSLRHAVPFERLRPSWRAVGAALLCGLILLPGSASSRLQGAQPSAGTLRQAAEGRHVIIGTAAASRYLAEADYSAILGSEFSQLQAENEMKFGPIHPRPDTDPNPYDFKGGDALVAFAQSHNMVVRGHTLVWHKQVPQWVDKGGFSATQLADILHSHIKTVMTHYASKVYAWDVVNEAFNDDGTMRHTIWYDQPGIGAGAGTKYIEQVLRWAREADSGAKLFYNDYDAEEREQEVRRDLCHGERLQGARRAARWRRLSGARQHEVRRSEKSWSHSRRTWTGSQSSGWSCTLRNSTFV